jgi:hypothetical protein
MRPGACMPAPGTRLPLMSRALWDVAVCWWMAAAGRTPGRAGARVPGSAVIEHACSGKGGGHVARLLRGGAVTLAALLRPPWPLTMRHSPAAAALLPLLQGDMPGGADGAGRLPCGSRQLPPDPR